MLDRQEAKPTLHHSALLTRRPRPLPTTPKPACSSVYSRLVQRSRCPSPPPHARWWKGWHWHAYSGIAAQLQYFPEQQTGFRSQRCTADSISDVVANLEDAKAMVDVAMLVFLDVQSAFDGLPYAVIEACPDCLGLSGCLRSFISAFLTGRTFRVRVGQELSEPRVITTGVPQGSVLSPFLFNIALARLPACLPADPLFP
ncbi:hypothetical protein HPB49_026246 [Dermacentor silvarum]|nr:hypothetical protein HPB49_026246 [Dermacentor silvarum]